MALIFLYVLFDSSKQISTVSLPGISKALITEDQNIIAELDLNKDQEVEIKTLKGNIVLEIKQKKIRVLHSKCPKNICMNTGFISEQGQTLVCVPNKIIIEIISDSSSEIDAFIY